MSHKGTCTGHELSLYKKNHLVDNYRMWADTIDAYQPKYEDSQIVKALKVGYFKTGFKKYCDYEQIKQAITENRPELTVGSKEYNRLADSIIYCKFCYGAKPGEFFKYSMDKLNHEGRRRLMPTGARYRVFTAFNGRFVLDKIDAKYDCYLTMKEFFGRECILLSDGNGMPAFDDFINRHKVCFAKPNRESCGIGAVRLTLEDMEHNHAVIRSLLENYGEIVVEENISQNSTMSSFHPQSVNTVRVMIIRLNNTPQMLFAGFRYGTGDSVVDNVGSGGTICMIDKATGIIKTSKDGNVYDRETGCQIIGAQVPEWEKLGKVIKAISDRLPEYRLFAVDMALDINCNWILVEANSHAELGGDRIIKECGYDYDSFIQLAGR